MCSIHIGETYALVAQLEEHSTVNRAVGRSKRPKSDIIICWFLTNNNQILKLILDGLILYKYFLLHILQIYPYLTYKYIHCLV